MPGRTADLTITSGEAGPWRDNARGNPWWASPKGRTGSSANVSLMKRMLASLIAMGACALLLGPTPVRAADPQITDPAGDHPADFADLTAVTLSVRTIEGREYLDVTFGVAGAITGTNRAVMTGYVFEATVGECLLTVSVNSYPDALGPAGLPSGSPHAECEGSDADLPGGYEYGEKTATVVVGLGDLPGLVKGAAMTELRAHTAWLQGAISTGGAIGDEASSDKPWTIA